MKLFYINQITDAKKAQYENKTVTLVNVSTMYEENDPKKIKGIYWRGETTDEYFEFLYYNGLFFGSIAERENELLNNRSSLAVHTLAQEYSEKITEAVPDWKNIQHQSDFLKHIENLSPEITDKVKKIFYEFVERVKNGELDKLHMDDIIEFLNWKKSENYIYSEL